MKWGARASDNSPWAMVVPPGNSFLARSWSTWIHCSSQVASAKRLMRSCVTSSQSLTPISVPIADLNSLKSLNIRIVSPRSDLHFRNHVGNDELGFRDRHDLGDADTGRGLQQGRLAVGEGDDPNLGHDQVHRPGRGQWQRALGDDLRFALRGVLHG